MPMKSSFDTVSDGGRMKSWSCGVGGRAEQDIEIRDTEILVPASTYRSSVPKELRIRKGRVSVGRWDGRERESEEREFHGSACLWDKQLFSGSAFGFPRKRFRRFYRELRTYRRKRIPESPLPPHLHFHSPCSQDLKDSVRRQSSLRCAAVTASRGKLAVARVRERLHCRMCFP